MDAGLKEATTNLEEALNRSKELKGKFTEEMMDVTSLDMGTVTSKITASEDKINSTKETLSSIDVSKLEGLLESE